MIWAVWRTSWLSFWIPIWLPWWRVTRVDVSYTMTTQKSSSVTEIEPIAVSVPNITTKKFWIATILKSKMVALEVTYQSVSMAATEDKHKIIYWIRWLPICESNHRIPSYNCPNCHNIDGNRSPVAAILNFKMAAMQGTNESIWSVDSAPICGCSH